MKHPEELESRREEIIDALNATAKPYFGDLKAMTYLAWAQRFADLAFPWVDETYADRFLHLLQRIEARVTTKESGEFASLFASRADVESDPHAAIAKLAEAYPQADELTVTPMDEAWFPVLVREYPKPMPFVPVIDNDLLRWWGQDQLWQSEDSRYSADSVRIIPGPISVAGITTVDEPVADILGRFEEAMVKRVSAESPSADKTAFAQLGAASSAEEFIRKSPNISWVGHLMANPAYGTSNGDANYEIRKISSEGSIEKYDLDIHLDTYWDNDPDGGKSKHAVRDIVIPLNVDGNESGLFPVVDRDRLPAIPPSPATSSPPCPLLSRWQTKPPIRSDRRIPATRCPPTSASTMKRPPAARCRAIWCRRASHRTHSSDRHGPPSTRPSDPYTSTASR